MRKCNRCKVIKNGSEFKNKTSKSCNQCREVSNKAYKLKKEGLLPQYAKVQKLLENAHSKGNFVCKQCGKEKPINNFGTHTGNNKYNLSRICKQCSIELNKVSKLLNMYGLSKKEFVEKLKEQNYKCKICKSNIKYLSNNKDKYGSACVDHDHNTGKVRGLLCSSCNRGIGLLKDDSTILYAAYKYLVQYKSDKLLENL